MIDFLRTVYKESNLVKTFYKKNEYEQNYNTYLEMIISILYKRRDSTSNILICINTFQFLVKVWNSDKNVAFHGHFYGNW